MRRTPFLIGSTGFLQFLHTGIVHDAGTSIGGKLVPRFAASTFWASLDMTEMGGTMPCSGLTGAGGAVGSDAGSAGVGSGAGGATAGTGAAGAGSGGVTAGPDTSGAGAA